MRTLVCSALLPIALVGCGDRTASDHSPPSAVAGTLPRLAEIPVVLPDDHQASSPFLSIGLTGQGTVTFRPGGRRDLLLTTIDSTGAVIAEWGRLGEGPGEMTGGEFILSGDSTVVLADVSGQPVRVYTPMGALVHQRSNPPHGLPSTLEENALYWWRSHASAPTAENPSPAERLEPLERWCVDRRCNEKVLGTDEPSLLAIHQAPPSIDGAYPAFAVERNRLVIGDGFSYTLWMHDLQRRSPTLRFGRNIPPRMATPAEIARAESSWARAERAGVPGPGGTRVRPDFTEQRREIRERSRLHFQYLGFGFDGRGRLWVIGRTNDSTFLDIFADTVFLGRLMVDCRRTGHASAVRGRWLALGCQNDDLSQPYRIRLFRIEES